ncbi:MAG TPA: hypothetical protein VJY35_05905 [Candidatus Eisenbacteria bacterium]|nr:hypothetical protein [Candidatus Eisenbacteria bacterium]
MNSGAQPASDEIRLAPRGAGRWFGAAFLLFWLCGWAMGEAFALTMLVKGAIALLTGTPITSGGSPVTLAAVLAFGAFLLFWLAIWTVGGIAAFHQVLLLLWSSDRLAVRGGALEVVHARGPFRRRREVQRHLIRRLALVPKHDRLVVETDRGMAELSTLGTRDDREQAMVSLRGALGLSDAPAHDDVKLPEGWEEIITPEGERALVASLATRRKQAWVAGVVVMVLAALTMSAAQAAMSDWPMLIPVVMLFAATIAAGWGAAWLARGRHEWRIGSGRIVQRRRYGATVRDVFEARRLELTTSSDSDGDDWVHLEALGEAPASAAGAAPDRSPVAALQALAAQKNRRRIAQAMNDASVPRQLALWLSRAADLPLEDRTTSQAQAMELTELRAQLEASGKAGKWAARLLDHVEVRRKKTG